MANLVNWKKIQTSNLAADSGKFIEREAPDQSLRNNLRTVIEIGRLEEDWNGHGATAFSESLILKILEILIVLPKQPDIYPTGRSSIQLQYELEDRSYLEFEVYETGTSCLCVPQRMYNEAEQVKFLDNEQERIREKVLEFYSGESEKRGNIISFDKKVAAQWNRQERETNFIAIQG